VTLFLFQTNLADFTANQWVTCFQETAEVILNTTAENLGQLKDSVRLRPHKLFFTLYFPIN